MDWKICALAVLLSGCAAAEPMTLEGCRARYAEQMAALEAERRQPPSIVASCDRRDRECLNRERPGVAERDSTEAVTRSELYQRQFEDCQRRAIAPR